MRKAEFNYSASRFNGSTGSRKRVGVAYRVYHECYRLLLAQSVQGGGRRLVFHQHVGSAASMAKFRLVRIASREQDFFCSPCAGGSYGSEPDYARPKDKNAHVFLKSAYAQPMNSNGNRFRERGSAKIERIGNAIQTPRRRHHVFGESTVGVNAENPKTAANGVPARGAKAAFAARKERFNDDPLTARIAGYSFAYCLYFSGRFVSKNCPRRHFRRFGVQPVHVASAYATGANTNQHLTRAGRRYRSPLDNDVVGAGINTGVHHSLCHRTVPLRLERPLDAAWCLATGVIACRMRLLLIVHVFAGGEAFVLAPLALERNQSRPVLALCCEKWLATASHLADLLPGYFYSGSARVTTKGGKVHRR